VLVKGRLIVILCSSRLERRTIEISNGVDLLPTLEGTVTLPFSSFLSTLLPNREAVPASPLHVMALWLAVIGSVQAHSAGPSGAQWPPDSILVQFSFKRSAFGEANLSLFGSRSLLEKHKKGKF